MSNLSNLIQIGRQLAERYAIRFEDLEKLCEQNLHIAAKSKRYEIVKVRLEAVLLQIRLLKLINFFCW